MCISENCKLWPDKEMGGKKERQITGSLRNIIALKNGKHMSLISNPKVVLWSWSRLIFPHTKRKNIPHCIIYYYSIDKDIFFCQQSLFYKQPHIISPHLVEGTFINCSPMLQLQYNKVHTGHKVMNYNPCNITESCNLFHCLF